MYVQAPLDRRTEQMQAAAYNCRDVRNLADDDRRGCPSRPSQVSPTGKERHHFRLDERRPSPIPTLPWTSTEPRSVCVSLHTYICAEKNASAAGKESMRAAECGVGRVQSSHACQRRVVDICRYIHTKTCTGHVAGGRVDARARQGCADERKRQAEHGGWWVGGALAATGDGGQSGLDGQIAGERILDTCL